MKIIIPLDFEHAVELRREGITLYLINLVAELLSARSDIELEFYTYDFHIEGIKELIDDICSKFTSRIRIVSNDHHLRLLDIIKNIFNIVFLCITFVYYYFAFIFFKKSKYKDKIERRKIKLKDRIKFDTKLQPITKKRKNLIRKIEKSDADAVYCYFVLIKLGHHFRGKKIVQVHDLFTIALPELFKTQILNINELNMQAKEILGVYAKQGAFFVSSSQYIAKEHSLKYIPNISKEQVKVISFPPMISAFCHSKISKDDFLAKYNITQPYMAFPSQNRPNKNWKLIFRALKILKDRGILIRFVTTGKISGLKTDELLVRELGIDDLILEVGDLSREDLYYLYKYSNIAVASNIIEGMGISAVGLEALSVGGIPVIHAKSLGIEESLANVGLTMDTADMNWIELDDYVGLADKIQEVLSNPSHHIDKQKHILQAYTKRSWLDVANDYIKLIENKK